VLCAAFALRTRGLPSLEPLRFARASPANNALGPAQIFLLGDGRHDRDHSVFEDAGGIQYCSVYSRFDADRAARLLLNQCYQGLNEPK
jgi:hypothetical protein